jgi:hypothetical protein
MNAHNVEPTADHALSGRGASFKERIHSEPRLVFLDQARLVTEAYHLHPGEPRIVQRAIAFAHSLRNIPITVGPDELIVGNRTPTSRAGGVFPEAAVNWIDREIETLPTRPQDPFHVTPAQVREFREEILPFWRGRTLEDQVYGRLDKKVMAASRVVKINQRDHAQGHIIPNVPKWLALLQPALLLLERMVPGRGAGLLESPAVPSRPRRHSSGRISESLGSLASGRQLGRASNSQGTGHIHSSVQADRTAPVRDRRGSANGAENRTDGGFFPSDRRGGEAGWGPTIAGADVPPRNMPHCNFSGILKESAFGT